MMKTSLVVGLLVGAAFGVDDYHSGDPAGVEAKIRLLGGLNATGIRGRLIEQAANLTDVKDRLREIQRGKRNIFLAVGQMQPGYDNVVRADAAVHQKLKSLDLALEREAENLARRIGSFATDFESSIMKKARDDPDQLAGVFKVYNQFVVTEFHQLTQAVSQVHNELEKSTRATLASNKAKISDQWRSVSVLQKMITKADKAFTSLLNRYALPLLMGTKYAANTAAAYIGKATLDTFDKLKDANIPDITKRGIEEMQKSAEKLKLVCQKLVMSSAKDVQRKLASLRSDLNRMQMKHNNMVNKNFTAINSDLDKAGVTVKKNRDEGRAKLERGAADAEQLANEFRSNILDTSQDLQGMLADEHSVVTAISQEAKLQAQDLDSGFGAKISAMADNMHAAGPPAGDINHLQTQIGQAYASGTGGVQTDLVQGTKSRIASALADASDQSSQLGGMFDSVSDQTRGAVDGDLAGRVGTANAAIADKQDQIKRRTAESADETRAMIDENTAEGEAARAGVVNSFQKGIAQSAGATGSMSDMSARSAQRAEDLSQSALSGREKAMADLTGQRDKLVRQTADVRDIAKRLTAGPQAALATLDKDNEGRLQSAFSQLNGVRQLAGSQGDKFEATATNFIAQMVAKATGELPWDSPSTANLTMQTTALKNASASYTASIAAMETALNSDMSKIQEQYAAVAGQTGADKQLGQIVAHSQAAVTDSARQLLRDIYNQTYSPNAIARMVASNKRLDTQKYFSQTLNTSRFDGRAKVLASESAELTEKRAKTKQGVDEFGHFLESLKQRIQSKMPVDLRDAAQLDSMEHERDNAVSEVGELESNMNATIALDLRTANESIANKTENFYRQFQTASIVADSLVQGFADYVEKMLDFERATEKQREATQDSLIKSLRTHVADAPVKFKDAKEIDRVNALVRAAMDSADESKEGQRKRKEAADALIAQYGQEAASKLMEKYKKMAANADALSASIEASREEMTGDRVAGVQGSQLGLDGISAQTQLFTTASADVIAAQKQNAAALANKIDELLSGGSFLTNITNDQLAAILMSVQNSDGVYQSQLSKYKQSTGSDVATLGGVVQSFGELVQSALNKTSNYLDALTKNYTALVKKTDAVTRDPVNALKLDLTKSRERAENVNATLRQHQLSIGPIEEGLEERIQSLGKRQDDFASEIRRQLDQMVTNIHKLDGDIAVSREEGMRKLRQALYDLNEGFKERALEMQSERVSRNSASLLQLESDKEIKQDMTGRIRLVKSLLAGKNS